MPEELLPVLEVPWSRVRRLLREIAPTVAPDSRLKRAGGQKPRGEAAGQDGRHGRETELLGPPLGPLLLTTVSLRCSDGSKLKLSLEWHY